MTQQKNFTTRSIHPVLLGKRILIGAGVAFSLISIFLLGVGEPNPAWGKLWMVKPLIVVPLAGAIGGVFYHFIDHIIQQDGWRKILVIVFSLIGYLVIVWLGTVLGLDGTLWN
ncbi:potassium transporter KefB [Catalinimonas niigatensis]|uniref:potassium transporter KefB n=1 Tax=Catalinimonas niigatensis TaxID=1397264 RepID=UPI0026662B16|nr:potassium transporter KefB [Catalinimonas niigatensis]WPP49157.1 potassium transporter KefB [Catalinimonas niigatensis]